MKLMFGLIIVVASVLGGYAAMGGHLAVLWQPFEIVIICGAAIGAFIMGHPVRVLKDTGGALRTLFTGHAYSRKDYLDLISLLFLIMKQAKMKGVMHLEKDIEHPYESELFNRFPRVLKHKRAVSFLCDYLRLISLGSERAFELEALMDEELDTLHREKNQPAKALKTVGEALPALGIIAAVLGVIKAMGAINQPPEVLGGLIGGALVGTFLGVLLSYGLVTPLANGVKTQREEELSYFTCMKAGLLAYLNGYPPQVCVEFARKVLQSDIQPSFDEVEKATQAAALAGRQADSKAAGSRAAEAA
jgi:chemotaxis protein MotA